MAGMLTTGENVVRKLDGKFARNPPHFAGHYFINFHFNQSTRDYYCPIGGHIYDRGKCGLGKMGEIDQNPLLYIGHNDQVKSCP